MRDDCLVLPSGRSGPSPRGTGGIDRWLSEIFAPVEDLLNRKVFEILIMEGKYLTLCA